MIDENIFIPRILLCGDKEEFLSRVGQRLFELAGQVEFFDEKFLLDGEPVGYERLPNLLREKISFIVFTDDRKLKLVGTLLYQRGCPRAQVVTLREFNHMPTDGFYDISSDNQLLMVLKNLPIRTLLDANAHFAKSYMMTKSFNESLEIDCICREDLPCIKENIYSHVYKNLSDCALKHYDAALVSNHMPKSFADIFSRLSKTVDVVITFCRYGSALEKYIRNTAANFKSVTVLPSSAGNWFLCYVKKPSEDFAMYVVTHKALPPEYVQSLPKGYKIIHAGRACGENIGYSGDDSRDNISNLNPYLNEITALYWLWKNTNHTTIGLSHYRRFFTPDGKNFLTGRDVFELLKNYDIITDKLLIHRAPSYEILRDEVCGEEIISLAARVIRKNLARIHPDYLEAFDYKMNSPTCYYKNMLVAHRHVFDAYCEWLFSFMLDSTKEVLSQTPLSKLSDSERRLMGHFSERMFTVWLIRNRLRIKEIPVVQVPGL